MVVIRPIFEKGWYRKNEKCIKIFRSVGIWSTTFSSAIRIKMQKECSIFFKLSRLKSSFKFEKGLKSIKG